MYQLKQPLAYLGIGLIAGVINKWGDELSSIVGTDLAQAVGGIGTAPGTWMLILVVIALLNKKSSKHAALHGMLFFIGLCIGYYCYSQFMLGYSGLHLVVFWLGLSLTVVPLWCGLLVWSRSEERPALIAALVNGTSMAVPLSFAIGTAISVYSKAPLLAVIDPVVISQLLAAILICLLTVKTWQTRLASTAISVVFIAPLLFFFDHMADIILWVRDSIM